MKLTSPVLALLVPSTELPRCGQVSCVGQRLVISASTYSDSPPRSPGSRAQKSLNKDRNGATTTAEAGRRESSVGIYSFGLTRVPGTLIVSDSPCWDGCDG